jgi:hypothetical protein
MRPCDRHSFRSTMRSALSSDASPRRQVSLRSSLVTPRRADPDRHLAPQVRLYGELPEKKVSEEAFPGVEIEEA